MSEKNIDIKSRKNDLKEINALVWNAEIGIRSICVMYDEHSNDKNSKNNIYRLKDNIVYRLFSASHHYLMFLRELSIIEDRLARICQDDPTQLNYLYKNPHFEKAEQDLSSVFDGIIFNLSSVFDYISHMMCYICKTNKSKTLYWPKLARLCRGQNEDFKGDDVKKIIDQVDREFVGRLYDYRSRLLHHKRDHHEFSADLNISNNKGFNFNIKLIVSSEASKHFKTIKEKVGSNKITLTYLSSWLLRESLSVIENLLDALYSEIKNNSSFHSNLITPKDKNSLLIINIDPQTKDIKPVSDQLWIDYKKGRAF